MRYTRPFQTPCIAMRAGVHSALPNPTLERSAQERCSWGTRRASCDGARSALSLGVARAKCHRTGEHMNQKLKRVGNRSWILAAHLLGLCQAGQVEQALGATPPATPAASAVTLFQNVRIFDGKSATLSGPSNVLVRGNKIE